MSGVITTLGAELCRLVKVEGLVRLVQVGVDNARRRNIVAVASQSGANKRLDQAAGLVFRMKVWTVYGGYSEAE